MIGAGGQAATQIEAVCAVRPIREVRIFDIARDRAEALRERMAQEMPGVTFRVAGSPNEAVSGADVVTTATTSSTPVFDAGYVSPGTHVNGIGAYTPEMQETPPGLVARARIVIDGRTGALAEAGDLIKPLAEGLIRKEEIVEIGEVLAGNALGRQSPEEITFFKSVGNAVQDVAVARLVLQAAEKDGWGMRIPL
jgi:ornithine cyclodeaminase